MILGEDPVGLAFPNIFNYLAGAYAAGGCFADYFDKVHDNNPGSFNNPWSCILYVDELHPGNQLAGNSRNTWAIYCSSAQFGATLSNSESWLTLLGKRSEQVSQLAASIGQCFRLILEHMFDNKYAHPHSEVLLQGGLKRLKLSVGCCNRPRNPVLVGKDARVQQNRVKKVEPGFWGWLFPAFTLAEWQAEVPEPSETNHPIHAWLYAWALPKWCAELGICFCGSKRLLPVVWLRFGRHMALCNFGPSLPFTNAIWKGYFCPKQWKATKKLGSSDASSEILGLYQVLAHYVQICCLPNGICLPGSTCSLAWCKVLDYRLSIPALEKPDYKQLLSFVEAALEATVAADWSEEFEPKMHWSLHIIVKVSRGMANYLHAGPWKGSTKALENRMSCATLPIGKLLWGSLSLQGTSIHWVKSQDCLEKAPAYKMPKGGPTKKMTAFLCNAGVVPVGMPCMQSSHCKLSSGNNYFWWCCLFAQCGWRLTSCQCSSRALLFSKSHVVMWPLSKNICSRKFQTNIRVLLLYKKSRVLSLTMLPKAGWHASPLHSCNFEGTCNFHPQQMSLENKLRWYAQQPQRFMFTNLSEACCQAKRWKHFSSVSVS